MGVFSGQDNAATCAADDGSKILLANCMLFKVQHPGYLFCSALVCWVHCAELCEFWGVCDSKSHSQILVANTATRPVLRQLLEQHSVEAVQVRPLIAPPVLQQVLTSGVAAFRATQLLEQQLMLFRHAWPVDNFSVGQPAAHV